jgi:hypothetical protein
VGPATAVRTRSPNSKLINDYHVITSMSLIVEKPAWSVRIARRRSNRDDQTSSGKTAKWFYVEFESFKMNGSGRVGFSSQGIP